MSFLPSILFGFLLFSSICLFVFNCEKFRNINLGKNIDRSDNKKERLLKMFRLAFGQSKMLINQSWVYYILLFMWRLF